MTEHHRCIVNQDEPDEWVAAGYTRKEVEKIILKNRSRVRTYKFFKIKIK